MRRAAVYGGELARQVEQLPMEPAEWGIQAEWVLPVDAPPLRRGVVTIRQGRIVSVDTAPSPGIPLRRHDDAVLLPGFINAHTHLEFSDLLRPLPSVDGSFAGWIESVVAHRRGLTAAPDQAIQRGQHEVRGSGCWGVCNIATSAPPPWPRGLPEPWLAIEYLEMLALRRDQMPAKMRLLADWCMPHHGPIYYRRGLSPHAPYSIHQDLFHHVVDMAERHAMPLAMHLAESADEMEILATHGGPLRTLLERWQVWDDTAFSRGTRPMDYLQAVSRSPGSLIIHGNYLTTQELAYLAQHRETLALVHCPRTHAFLGHDQNPLREALRLGVKVLLGTDSRASNPDLSVLSEMQALAAAHPWLDPARIVEMVTRDPAQHLDRAPTPCRSSGTLRVGAPACMTLVRVPQGASHPYAFLSDPQAVAQAIHTDRNAD